MSRCLSIAKFALLLNVLFINSILSFSSCILQNVPQASYVIFIRKVLFIMFVQVDGNNDFIVAHAFFPSCRVFMSMIRRERLIVSFNFDEVFQSQLLCYSLFEINYLNK